MELIKNPYKTVTAMKMSTAEVKGLIMTRTTMIPSTLERKITPQMMSFLLLSITREQVERPAATHPGRLKGPIRN